METKRNTNIEVFLDANGKIKKLPVPNRTKTPVLQYLCTKFETGKIYDEKEVNRIIDQWHTFGDYFILRRSLIDYGLMARTANGAQYWVVTEELRWTGDGNSNNNTR